MSLETAHLCICRSTDSLQHAEVLIPVMNLIIQNLTTMNLTIGGGFQHPEDLSQGIGAIRATCWALVPSPLLD